MLSALCWNASLNPIEPHLLFYQIKTASASKAVVGFKKGIIGSHVGVNIVDAQTWR